MTEAASSAPPPPPPPPPPLEGKQAQQAVTAFQSQISSQRESFRTYFGALQGSIPQLKSQYKVYEDTFFKKVKDELLSAKEQPAVAYGVAIAAGLLLMRGPRRFLFRQTLGRFRDKEALFAKAVKDTKELEQVVKSVKLETKKLLERASVAEQEIQNGRTKLKDTGHQIQSLVKQIKRMESEATDFMEELREIAAGDALKLRKEVASMTSLIKVQKSELEKEITEISEQGIRI